MKTRIKKISITREEYQELGKKGYLSKTHVETELFTKNQTRIFEMIDILPRR